MTEHQAIRQLLRPIQQWLAQPEITELTINRAYEVWSKSRGDWTAHAVPALSLSYLHSLATALIAANGLNPKSVVSVILPDGERGQIVLPPACIPGTLSLTIRKHNPVIKTLVELEQAGAFQAVQDVSFNPYKTTSVIQSGQSEAATNLAQLTPIEQHLLALKSQGHIRPFLEYAVQAKCNIVIAGKTGSGKTTFARSLIEQVPPSERLITIEDVHELILSGHPNRVYMLYGDGVGRISADACLASCLRQSPDRIFLSELRGHEAWAYLNALNTGHPGSITTVHANNAQQTFERIAALIKQSSVGQQLELTTIKHMLYTTLNIVLFIDRWQLTELFYDPLFGRQYLV